MEYINILSRQFLRTTRGIIPLVYGGIVDSTDYAGYIANASQTLKGIPIPAYKGKEKPVGWCLVSEQMLEVPQEELIDIVKLADAGHSCNIAWINQVGVTAEKDVAKWYTNGCKKAVPLEYIVAANPNAQLYCQLVKEEPASESTYRRCFKTTQGVEAWIDEAKEYVRENPCWHICMGFTVKKLSSPLPMVPETEPVLLMQACSGFRAYVKAISYTEGKGLSIQWTGNAKNAKRFFGTDDFIYDSRLRRAVSMFKLTAIPAASVHASKDKKYAMATIQRDDGGNEHLFYVAVLRYSYVLLTENPSDALMLTLWDTQKAYLRRILMDLMPTKRFKAILLSKENAD